jgi:hypothetical protein
MTFRTVTTFEKIGDDVKQMLYLAPGVLAVVNCFNMEVSPYISHIEEKVSDDRNYLEIHIYFHDTNAYNSWHDEWKDLHDEIRNYMLDHLESSGITIKRYWETSDLARPGSLPISEFVTRF